MKLNSLEAVQTKKAIETEKQIPQLLNYSASHLDSVTEYTRNGMILDIFSDAYYISEPEAFSREGGYYPLFPKSKKPKT